MNNTRPVGATRIFIVQRVYQPTSAFLIMKAFTNRKDAENFIETHKAKKSDGFVYSIKHVRLVYKHLTRP